jgi:hypothetical protein
LRLYRDYENWYCVQVNVYRAPHFAFGLWLACCAVSAQTIPSLGIYVDFEGRTSEASVAAMKGEITRILGGSFQVNWRWLKENAGTETFGEVAVLTFAGDCRAGGKAAPPSETTVILASTPVVDGKVLPVSRVECDEIKRSVGAAANNPGDGILGRAFGKVAAHELYHILENTTSHSVHGLAKAIFTPFDLVFRTMAIEPDRPERLKQARRPGMGGFGFESGYLRK